jgi:hypothetical protein
MHYTVLHFGGCRRPPHTWLLCKSSSSIFHDWFKSLTLALQQHGVGQRKMLYPAANKPIDIDDIACEEAFFKNRKHSGV